eukprot:jgi/Mesen1/10418/ME000818S09898
MATSWSDLGVSAAINMGVVLLFLVLYSVFSQQPINARVYFAKWFVMDEEAAAARLEGVHLVDDDGEGGRPPRVKRQHVELDE